MYHGQYNRVKFKFALIFLDTVATAEIKVIKPTGLQVFLYIRKAVRSDGNGKKELIKRKRLAPTTNISTRVRVLGGSGKGMVEIDVTVTDGSSDEFLTNGEPKL